MGLAGAVAVVGTVDADWAFGPLEAVAGAVGAVAGAVGAAAGALGAAIGAVGVATGAASWLSALVLLV